MPVDTSDSGNAKASAPQSWESPKVGTGAFLGSATASVIKVGVLYPPFESLRAGSKVEPLRTVSWSNCRTAVSFPVCEACQP